MSKLSCLLLRVIVVVIVAACSGTGGQEATNIPGEPLPRPTIITDDPILAQGQELYDTYCAHCHGYNGEGQHPDTVENTVSLGYHIVPPHNSDGHTWKHPDALLLQVIQQGIDNPLDLYIMAGYADRMSDAEIMSVIEYMKLWWTDEQRQYQAEITANWQARQEEISGD